MWLTLFVAYGRVERGRSTANRPPPASPSRARSGRKMKFLPPLPKEAICISCTIHCLNVRSASNNPQYTTRYSHTLLAGIGVPEGGGAGAAGRPRRRGAERSCRRRTLDCQSSPLSSPSACLQLGGGKTQCACARTPPGAPPRGRA